MARTKKAKTEVRLAGETLASSHTTARANPLEDVQHVISKFNRSLQKWRDHKVYINREIVPLKNALQSAHRNLMTNAQKAEFAGSVDDFEDLISRITAAQDGNIGHAITTEVLTEEAALDMPETGTEAQVDGNNDIKPEKPDLSRLKVKEGDVKIEALEQVITTYQTRAVACVNIGLKTLAELIHRPESIPHSKDERMVEDNDRATVTSKSAQNMLEHTLSEFRDQMQVILDRARLLSTYLLYGSWNAACEMLESCEDHVSIKAVTQPDLQLIKEELEYVLHNAGDLPMLFNIEPNELEAAMKAANHYKYAPIPAPKLKIVVFELTVIVVEEADIKSQFIWESEAFQMLGDRCRSPSNTIKMVNHLCGEVVKASLPATDAHYFNFFCAKVPGAANPAKNLKIGGSRAWQEWYIAISEQQHLDEVKVTFWFHLVSKRNDDLSEKLFRAKEWMTSG